MVISETRFKELKRSIRGNATLKLAATREGVSYTTIQRVNRAKDYAHFKAILVADRGPKYAEKRVASSTSSTGTKKGWWTKFLNFFDISTS